MPATTEIVPLASAERSASETGAALDLGANTTVDLTLDVTAVATALLIVYVETARSATSTTWTQAGAFTATSGTGARTQTFADLERWVRLRWELSGTATFSASGESVTVYCRPRDMKRVVASRALFHDQDKTYDNAQLDEFARDASDEADGSLGAMFSLPLTAWRGDLRRKTAELAVYFALFHRGFSPDDEAGKGYRKMHDDVQTWLKAVRDQKLELQGIVDSTPEIEDGGAYIVTDSPRGWGS